MSSKDEDKWPKINTVHNLQITGSLVGTLMALNLEVFHLSIIVLATIAPEVGQKTHLLSCLLPYPPPHPTFINWTAVHGVILART